MLCDFCDENALKNNTLYCKCYIFALNLMRCYKFPVMRQTTISVRVDEKLKKNFDELCDSFGLSCTAAFTVFMKAVVRERCIPFDIRTDNRNEINAKGWEAILQLGRQAEEAGIQDMSLKEINAIIKEVRDAK